MTDERQKVKLRAEPKRAAPAWHRQTRDPHSSYPPKNRPGYPVQGLPDPEEEPCRI